jgi:hypothetical protein
MNTTYYTPDSEEFCIGLECQDKYTEGWKDRKIRHSEDLCEIVSRYTTDKESVRVKYLDQEDIESLEFKKLETKPYEKLKFINIKNTNRDERVYLEDDLINEGFGKYVAIENNCGGFYFKGWLKNKKEFQKLLAQLNI